MKSLLSPNQPYVLLTGATGMVGAQILARLLVRQVPVVVLARDSTSKSNETPVSAHDRIERRIRKFEASWGRNLKRPIVMQGDINQPNLGIGDNAIDWLRVHCGQVIHSAASLSFRPAAETTDNEPYRSNVDGTARLVALCDGLGVDDFHYISTAYVCGSRKGQVLETDAECGQPFSNDYERSKLQAERLLTNHKQWKRLTIYRPSIVIDSTGLSPVSQDRTVYGAFSMFHALASQFGLPERGEWFRNLGLAGDHYKNLVEATWVADAMVGIFADPTLHGRTYHLTARTGTSIDQMEQAFYEVTAESLQNRKSASGNGSLSKRTKAVVAAPRTRSVANGRSSIMDAIAAPFVETFLPYFRDDPTFLRSNIDDALRQISLPEQVEIGAPTLAAMIRLGKTPESRINQHVVNAATLAIANHAGLWNSQLAGESNSWGVVISGPGGGDYCCCSVIPGNQMRIAWGGESCCQRIYLTSECWEALCNGESTSSELLTSGRLLIEYDYPETETRGSESTDNELQTAVEQLICGLRGLFAHEMQDVSPKKNVLAPLTSRGQR